MTTIEQANRTILHLYGAARECRLDEFYEEAMRLLKQSLHFDSGAIIQASLRPQGIDVQAMHNHRQPVEKLHDRRSLHGPDPTLVKAIHQAGRCLTDELTALDPRRYQDIIAYARKYDVAHSLVLVAPGPSAGAAHVVSLWRAPQSKRYGDAGRRIADLLLPHLLQARRINEQGSQLRRQATHGNDALLVADAGGCLRYFDDHAVARLRDEWPDWSPPMLPQGLLNALGTRARAHWAGKRIRAHIAVAGTSIHVYLGERSGDTALTPAESRVAWLAAEGASYKAIATALGTSPATVRNQLHRVYRKLGVASKAALARRLSAS